jgi:hypothetical protein
LLRGVPAITTPENWSIVVAAGMVSIDTLVVPVAVHWIENCTVVSAGTTTPDPVVL